jgi:hypothetical protein
MPLTVIVAGALANKPFNGGEAWVRLNWVLGLRALGHRVHLVEQIEPGVCVDDSGEVTDFGRSRNARFFAHCVRAFDLEDSATLILGEGNRTIGWRLTELLELAEDADLLVNISGHLQLPCLLAAVRRRVFVDLDPGFTQSWALDGDLANGIADHDLHFTVATSIGRRDCLVPEAGIDWHPLPPPITLDLWPPTGSAPAVAFTTVATWRNPFGPVSLGGRSYGLKHHEFRKIVGLGRRVSTPLEIALDIHPADDADRRALIEHGWRLRDPSAVASTPAAFRRYVQASAAELSVAQGVYVETRSGWISDRTACYLASGRPALVQSTGFEETFPTGQGLLTFSTLDEAVDGVERIVADYPAHAAAARRLAERCFASEVVIGDMLSRALQDSGPSGGRLSGTFRGSQ